MHLPHPTRRAKLAFLPAILAVSACSTSGVPSGFTAGAPSAHVPQSYETMPSSAAVTSTLGGSAILSTYVTVPNGSVLSNTAVVQITGQMTHNTRGIVLDDGVSVFTDLNGPDATGKYTSGTDDMLVGADSGIGSYTYITGIGLNRYSPARQQSLGYIGIVSNAEDIPVAGSASYSGDTIALLHYNAFADWNKDQSFAGGTSTVDIDFSNGTGAVTMGNFASIIDYNGVAVPAAAAVLDQITGTGLQVSGAHLTGGTWQTLKAGGVVHVVGAGETAAADATLFGYNPAISAPDTVAGVVRIESTSAGVSAFYSAN